MKRRQMWIAAGIALCIVALIMLGPMDYFSHGFFPDEIDIQQIADEDVLGLMNVDDEDCFVVFSPRKAHFAGVELFLVDHSPENGGMMTMTISDPAGRLVDENEIDLGRVRDSAWYKVYTNTALQEDEQYTIRFAVSGTASAPSFLLVRNDYLGDETVDGNILISYAYKNSTFSISERVFLSLAVLALLILLLRFAIPVERFRRQAKTAVLFLVLTTGLAWNYLFNSLDNHNTDFAYFQSDSETLVTGMIYAEQDGIQFSNESDRAFGLGRYYSLKGFLIRYGLSYITDDNWNEGYARTFPAIVVDSNTITQRIAVPGNSVGFKNGEEYMITGISDNGDNISIYLNAERPLSPARNGSLDDTIFYDSDHLPMSKSLITAYGSQYGLQGKVFRHLARYMNPEDALSNLYLICSLATASVFVLIVLLLKAKYGTLFAGCFYLTFALSPWIVNYARNIFWVEFTWFIPMAAGLVCTMKIDSGKWRRGCFAAVFVSVAGKCLCGYEFVTTIMMGMISFMMIDLLLAVAGKDKGRAKLLFRSAFCLGTAALLGFFAALYIHASYRGNGSIVDGIKSIIVNDVLRRTAGADLNAMDPVLWPSLNASVWEVFCKYFHFSTEIVTGVPGNLFPLLCLIPLTIFLYEIRKKKADLQGMFMYGFFFLSAVSWFCLAKSHSYVHGHMNYVLWYFGFVQTCFYVIAKRVVDAFSMKPKEGE